MSVHILPCLSPHELKTFVGDGPDEEGLFEAQDHFVPDVQLVSGQKDPAVVCCHDTVALLFDKILSSFIFYEIDMKLGDLEFGIIGDDELEEDGLLFLFFHIGKKLVRIGKGHGGTPCLIFYAVPDQRPGLRLPAGMPGDDYWLFHYT